LALLWRGKSGTVSGGASSENSGLASGGPVSSSAVKHAAPAFLSDLPETDVRIGWGTFGKHGTAYDNQRIIVKGVLSPNGLFMHPPSNGSAHVTYRLGKRYQTFKAAAAIMDTETPATALIFKVIGDGKDLWQSQPLKEKGASQQFTIPVAGIDKLELEVHCPGDYSCAVAVWLEPQVLP
jgi:endo-alpha-N-acetylgalactosaminidase